MSKKVNFNWNKTIRKLDEIKKVVDSDVPNWKTELEKIDSENCPQRQDSLSNQMYDLYHIANKFGFYDAADYIRRTFIKD